MKKKSQEKLSDVAYFWPIFFEKWAKNAAKSYFWAKKQLWNINML